MEDAGGEAGVHVRDGAEELDEVVDAAGATGGDDRDVHDVADRLQHLEVEAVLDAVGVDGIEHHFPGAVVDTAADPLDAVHAGVLPAALGEHVEGPVDPLHVGGDDDTLVAEALRRFAHEVRVADGARVDGHLVGAAGQNPVEVVEGVDTAADRERDEDLRRRPGQDVGEQFAPFKRRGDVVKHQFIGAALRVVARKGHRVRDVLDAFKVDSLHDPSIADVETGNDAFRDHRFTPGGRPPGWRPTG